MYDVEEVMALMYRSVKLKGVKLCEQQHQQELSLAV